MYKCYNGYMVNNNNHPPVQVSNAKSLRDHKKNKHGYIASMQPGRTTTMNLTVVTVCPGSSDPT